jgi:hypothetical protein
MPAEQALDASGYTVGELLRISCEPRNARVTEVTPYYVTLEWPWRGIDNESRRFRWSGRVALPRDPNHFEWHNTPWRVDPEPHELQVGDLAIVGILPTTVRIMRIRRHDPPLELGWLPRPEATLGVCFQGDEDDDEAGFALYQPSREPIVIERVDGAQSFGG